MYLIDNSYFTGKYEIANILESNNGTSELLEQFIDIEVRMFLEALLGLELFTDFDSYVTDGVLDITAPQKWQDLVYGVVYDSKKWQGLLYSYSIYKKSLLTNYIWCKYYTDKNRIDGNGNSNVIDSKNATIGNTANQYYPIWNEFVSLVNSYIDNDYVSLNQFLSDKATDYPTANFLYVNFENRFL